jgi:hypothetical protein
MSTSRPSPCVVGGGRRIWAVLLDAPDTSGDTGPIDGVTGPNTYKAEHQICACAVNRAF